MKRINLIAIILGLFTSCSTMQKVNYETVEENGKTKYKEVKENPMPRRSFNPEANNKAAMVGMALKIAFSSCYDKKEENFQETVALAQRIVDVAMDMLEDEESPM